MALLLQNERFMQTAICSPRHRLSLQLLPETNASEIRRILVVEDDATLRRTISFVLTGLGYTVIQAGSVEQAKAAVRTADAVSLILSDYHLPDGTGLDFLDWLIAEWRVEPPFILMSGEYLSTLNIAGDFLFLPKPFSSEQLKDLVEQTCALHSARGGLSGSVH